MVRQPDHAMALSSYFPGHGDRAFGVEHYDLSLRYRVTTNWLDGVAALSLVLAESTADLTLDLGPFRVSGVTVDGAAVRYTHQQGRLRLTLTSARPSGTRLAVEVRYAGAPRPVQSVWGGLGWEELTDGALVAGQPIGAPSWFPCNDRPDDKATYRIAVSTASAYLVVANGELIERRRAAGATTWVYAQEQPMASYLASVQIGRYRLAGGLACPPGLAARARHDFGRQDAMMTLFADRFGPYPFDRYTVVVTDDELEIPVEAQGLSIFGRNHVDGRRGSERLVAHELAHQWFGNSLTAGHWRDIWLHEGFAAYAEWLWSEESGGPPAAEHARRWHRRLTILPQDFLLADPGPDLLFDDRVYKRGALTVHGLRRELGDQVFFTMLRSWTAEHRHGTVTTETFVSHAQRHTPYPLGPFFSAWLYGPRLP